MDLSGRREVCEGPTSRLWLALAIDWSRDGNPFLRSFVFLQVHQSP